jgi:acyl-CoA synthetase (NDP forming)
MAQGLDRLLRPRSIAVIGGREAEKCVVECLRIGFPGKIYPISKSRPSMAGIPSLASLDDLPEAPDATFIAIPAEPTIEAVRQLSAMGAGGVVLYASGFAETGAVGLDRQKRLLEAAGTMGMLGPNCYGTVNYLEGVALWPDDHGGHRLDRGVALVSQSGNVAISLSMQERGVPVAQLAALGNQAKDGVPQIMQSLLRDDRITAIGLFVESVGDIPGFCEAAQEAARKGIPVVVLKTGNSEAAARVALSHTSSMTGSSAAFNALCDRLAVVRAESLSQLLEYLKLFHLFPGLPGNRLMTMSCSGGEAGIMADIAYQIGLPMPAFSSAAQNALNAVLGDKVVIDNPLDYHTYIWGNQASMTACFSAALADDFDVGLLALDTPLREGLDLFGWKEAEAAIIAAASATGRPTIVASSLSENMPRRLQASFLAAGIVPLQGFDDALKAVKVAAWYTGARRRSLNQAPLLPNTDLNGGKDRMLDEWRAKKVLSAQGLPVPQGVLVASETEAVAAADALGYPVVVKACSATLAHKTEAGGVALNLIDGQAVSDAVTRMDALAPHFIVEKMAQNAVCEIILGMTRDPQIGPMLMIGAGGILAELIGDATVLLLPATQEEVERALDRLLVAKLLAGFRGKPAGDRQALIAAIMAVARFIEENKDRLVEMDINPLIVLPQGQGVLAVDAVIRWVDAP